MLIAPLRAARRVVHVQPRSQLATAVKVTCDSPSVRSPAVDTDVKLTKLTESELSVWGGSSKSRIARI